MPAQVLKNPILLLDDNYRFEIPVYIIQGEKDILTPKEITKVYFDKIKAPVKEIILVPEAAHGFNGEVVSVLQKFCLRKLFP